MRQELKPPGDEALTALEVLFAGTEEDKPKG